jgi:hypothetical protein
MNRYAIDVWGEEEERSRKNLHQKFLEREARIILAFTKEFYTPL